MRMYDIVERERNQKLNKTRSDLFYTFIVVIFGLILSVIIILVLNVETENYSGWIVDKVHRERYVTTNTTTICNKVGTINICRPQTNTTTHPDKWFFLLRQCDSHNNCSYNTQYVDQNTYNQYQWGEYYPRGQ